MWDFLWRNFALQLYVPHRTVKTEGSSLLVCETMDVGGAVVVVTRAPLQQRSVSYGNILPVCSKGTLDKMTRVFFFFFFHAGGDTRSCIMEWGCDGSRRRAGIDERTGSDRSVDVEEIKIFIFWTLCRWVVQTDSVWVSQYSGTPQRSHQIYLCVLLFLLRN